MKSRKILLFVIVLALIGSGAGALTWLKAQSKARPPRHPGNANSRKHPNEF